MFAGISAKFGFSGGSRLMFLVFFVFMYYLVFDPFELCFLGKLCFSGRVDPVCFRFCLFVVLLGFSPLGFVLV